jgi:hypothetical protein
MDHDSERIRAHGAAHVADVHGGARAISTWPSSYHAREASDQAAD